MSDLRLWLEKHDLEPCISVFEQNDVDLRVIAHVTDDELKELGLSLGFRKRLAVALSADPPLVIEAGASNPGRAENRQISVMFLDLVGSVALSHSMDSEDYRDLLTRFRLATVAVVERYKGFVARHQGDGLLVYFGYPIADESDAERATIAGLAVVKAVKGLATPDGVEARVRVGIATGLAIVGDILETDASERAEFAALGKTPNLAARLQGVAAEDTVVISNGTFELVHGSFNCERIKIASLKGFNESVECFRVYGRSDLPTRFGIRAKGGLSLFVGRETELEYLRRCWDLTRTGLGQIVVLVGEAGLGKSRLVSRFLEEVQVDTDALSLIQTQCSAYLNNVALHPIIASINTMLDLDRESFRSKLVQLEHWYTRVLEPEEQSLGLLAQLLSIDHGGRFVHIGELDPKHSRNQTLRLLVRYVRELAHRKPTMIVVEDLHWADPSTSDLLSMLVDEIDSSAVMVIATSRPPFESSWSRQASTQTLELCKLGRQEAMLLAREAEEHDSLGIDIIDNIVARADGNPLYLEEISRAVLASEKSSSVPATLRDSLMARLDRLEHAKFVALSASVLGRVFTYSMLQAIWESDDDSLNNGLDELLREGLLQIRSGASSFEYQFKHALVQEAAHESLLRDERVRLHTRAARAVQASDESNSLNEKPLLLARHWSESGNPARAIDHLEQSAEFALNNFAIEEAEAQFERIISIESDAEIDIPNNRKARWFRQLNDAYYANGKLVRCERACREALRLLGHPMPTNGPGMVIGAMLNLSRQLARWIWPSRFFIVKRHIEPADTLEAARVFLRLGNLSYLNNRVIETIFSCFKGVNVAETAGPSEELALGYANAAVAISMFGLNGRARKYLSISESILEGLDCKVSVGYLHEMDGLVHVATGDWVRAEQHLVSGITIFRELGHSQHLFECQATLGWVYARTGQIELFLDLSKKLFQQSRSIQSLEGALWGAAFLLWGKVNCGCEDYVGEALDYLEEVKTSSLFEADAILVYGIAAQAHWRSGEFEKAREYAERVVQVVESGAPTTHYVVAGLVGAAEVLLEMSRKADAKLLRKRIGAVCGQQRRLMMMYPIARPAGHLILGQFHQACGRNSRAKRHWRKGLKSARKLGMPLEESWLTSSLKALRR